MGELRRRVVAAQPHLVTASGETLGIAVAEPKLNKLAVTFAPVQSGSGTPSPSNVRPISGWSEIPVRLVCGKNLIPPTVYNIAPLSGAVAGNASYRSMVAQIDGGKTYTISRNAVSGNRFRLYATVEYPSVGVSVKAEISSSGDSDLVKTFTMPTGCNYLLVYLANNSSTITSNVQLEVGSTATTYEPYHGITPSIPLGGTYYGGTVDLVSGTMTVTHGVYKVTNDTVLSGATLGFTYIDMANTMPMKHSTSAPNPDGCSDMFPTVSTRPPVAERTYASTRLGAYDSGRYYHYIYIFDIDKIYPNITTKADEFAKIKELSPTFVYELETPQTVQLTPQTILALRGQQTVTSPATQRENLWTESDPYEINPTNAPYGYRKLIFPTPLPPGTYRFSAAITSNDTDATTCCVRFMTESDADSSDRSEAQSRVDRSANGESHSLDYVTTAATHHLYLYTSTNSPRSMGDTATYRNIRIERIDTSTGTIDISYWTN